MEELRHCYDCSNTLIFICKQALDPEREIIEISYERYAKAVKTLSAPVMVIELNNPQTRYYFRSIC